MQPRLTLQCSHTCKHRAYTIYYYVYMIEEVVQLIQFKFTVNNDLSILPPSSPMGLALEEIYQQYQNR